MPTHEPAWFVVGRSAQLSTDTVFPFTLFDTPWVLFRDSTGVACCVQGHCSHRGAGLQDGRCVRGELVCRYHGWTFDGHGRCVRVPGIPGSTPHTHDLSTRPVVETEGLLWVGPAGADADAMGPRTSLRSRRGTTRVYLDVALDAPWLWVLENVADFSHVPFAHRSSVGFGRQTEVSPIELRPVEDEGRRCIDARLDLTDRVPLWGRRLEIAAHQRYRYPAQIETRLMLSPTLVYRLYFFLQPEGERRTRFVYVGERSFFRAPAFDWLEKRLMSRVFDEDRALLRHSDLGRLRRSPSTRLDAFTIAALREAEHADPTRPKVAAAR